MYDEARKKQFLLETGKSVPYHESIFKITESAEEACGKDLCELPSEVIQKLVDENFGVRARSVETAISSLQAYESWCKDHGYPVSGAASTLEVHMEGKLSEVMVASPKHLERVLNEVFDPIEDGTLDSLYRCYIWMAFMGFTENEAIEIKASEVDFENLMIHHNGKSFEMYRESLPAFRKACSATEFVYKNGRYKKARYNNEAGAVRERRPGDLLMRGVQTDAPSIQVARNFVYKRARAKGVKLAYGKIHLSGLFYNAYETERSGGTVNFDDAVMYILSQKKRTYHSNYTKRKLSNIIKNGLLEDYEHWKETFRV